MLLTVRPTLLALMLPLQLLPLQTLNSLRPSLPRKRCVKLSPRFFSDACFGLLQAKFTRIRDDADPDLAQAIEASLREANNQVSPGWSFLDVLLPVVSVR